MFKRDWFLTYIWCFVYRLCHFSVALLRKEWLSCETKHVYHRALLLRRFSAPTAICHHGSFLVAAESDVLEGNMDTLLMLEVTWKSVWQCWLNRPGHNDRWGIGIMYCYHRFCWNHELPVSQGLFSRIIIIVRILMLCHDVAFDIGTAYEQNKTDNNKTNKRKKERKPKL